MITKNIFFLLLVVSIFACSEDMIPEESFIPMNPDSEGGEPVVNPYWDWADKFPGPVPMQLPRLKDTTVTIKGGYLPFVYDAEAEALQSTGMYVPQGEIVTVEVPRGVAGLHYQIGIHARKLEAGQVRLRYEDVAVKGELVPGVNKIMNWFGGFLYFYYAAGQEDSPDVQLTVSGAVATSDFILGQTDGKAWIQGKVYNLQQDTIVIGADTVYEPRQALKWTELRSDKVILTVGTSELKQVTDPAVIMELYGKIFDSYYAFRGLDPTGQMPVRIYSDIQLPDPDQTPASETAKVSRIGEYPIAFIRVTGDDPGKSAHLLNADHLRGQKDPNGELWLNMYYAWNELFRSEWDKADYWKIIIDRLAYYYHTERNGWWPGKYFDPVVITNQITQYNPDRPDNSMVFEEMFEDNKPAMLIQLVNEVGWELFPYVSRKCREIHFVNEWQQDAVDFFMMCASEYANKDLTPFFRFWKVPISAYALDYMKNFPQAEEFWKTFDYYKKADFEPRTPNTSFERGTKPVMNWLVASDRSGWAVDKNGNVALDQENVVKITGLGFYGGGKGFKSMVDGNEATFAQCNNVPAGAVKWRLAVNMNKKQSFNAIHLRTFNIIPKSMEVFEIWENNQWKKVDMPVMGVMDPKRFGKSDNYFYLPEVYNTTKVRMTFLLNGPTMQVTEFNLGTYAAPDGSENE